MSGRAPQCAQLVLVLEELRQLAKQHLHELLGGHGRAVRVPERGAHHVLNGTLFAVGQLHFRLRLLLAHAWALTANRARFFRTFARCLSAHRTWLRYRLHALAGVLATLLARFRLQRLAVPFRIAEMVVRLHEVVDGEVVLAIVKPCAAPDDLLELDHGVDRAHQDDVANVAGIHAGREFLRGGQNRRDGLFVVLKVPEMLVAEFAIVGGDPLAIIRVGARLHLVDEVAHGQRMVLCGAEDQRLFLLVNLLHEHLHAVRFALLDLDDLVEVGFRVALSGSQSRPPPPGHPACRHTRRASWKSALRGTA